MNEVLKQIGDIGIVPVIKIQDTSKAVPLARALCEGGLPIAEVTFRTEQAEEAMRLISKEVPQMLVGAGTVLTIEQVDRAVAAGAKFIVSPGLNPRVVKYCVDKGIPVTPGCSNPSDVEQAIELGLEVVKFFPAEPAGGIAMIKAMAAPYSKIKFIPTGGINSKNLNDYLSFPRIIACGGSWMVKDDLIRDGKFNEITALTREAVMKMLNFKLQHVGINANDSDGALAIAKAFAVTLPLPVNRDTGISVFAGKEIEVMKGCGRGTRGHIAFSCNYPARAVSYLKSQGVSFDESNAKFDENGNLMLIYLANEIGGFAVHLVKN